MTTTTGAGAGSSTGGATASSSTTTATSGAGAGTVEDCLNGTDDDGDMLADCVDPDCQVDFECVPSAPGAEVYGAPPSAPGACPAEAPATTYGQCDGCACDGVAGTCQMSADYFFEDSATCGGNVQQFSTPEGCSSGPSGPRSIAITSLVADGNGSCAASSPTVPTSPFEVCAASATGACADANAVCVPALDARCVVMGPGASCPAAYPVARAQVAAPTVATCDCACTKGAETCDPVALVSGVDACFNATAVPLDPNQCTSLGSIESLAVPTPETTVACDPSATPTGGATQAICCES